ncbi:hypothetical protein IWX90DRAFT_487855 [Phyllosticta citrichinensis]|uniref:Uncharacterized protein n=1 Tax=Phyllosticta citrichinensis TaxID=1130410 RepID=A0ABR1XM57_9PEZI
MPLLAGIVQALGMSTPRTERPRSLDAAREDKPRSSKEDEDASRTVAEVDMMPDSLIDSQLEGSMPFEDADHTIADLTSQVKELKSSNEQQAKILQRLWATLRRRESELETSHDTLRDERIKFVRARDDLLFQLRKIQNDLDTATSDLRNAQISTFKQARSEWLPEEDSKVRDDVSQLYKDIRSWAKTYARSGFSCANVLSSADYRYGQKFFRRVRRVATLSGIDEIKDMKHLFLVLAALLSEHLRLMIFRTPFFWLKDTSQSLSPHEVFDRLFLTTCETRTSEAHLWRAQLMRFLFKNGDHEIQDEPIESDLIPYGFAEFLYTDIVKGFLERYEKILMDGLNKEDRYTRNFELFKLVTRSANLYGRLQTQRTSYFWTSADSCLGDRFSVSLPHMKADRLHKLDEDEEDTSIDGSKVKIVLSPTVFASGNSQGEDYDSQRVIAKAVVYLEEEEGF